MLRSEICLVRLVGLREIFHIKFFSSGNIRIESCKLWGENGYYMQIAHEAYCIKRDAKLKKQEGERLSLYQVKEILWNSLTVRAMVLQRDGARIGMRDGRKARKRTRDQTRNSIEKLAVTGERRRRRHGKQGFA